MRKDHATSNIVIKKADVDKKIIPVVNWLNSFASVTTKWSCQGDAKDSKSPWLGPYVVFSCDQLFDLLRIVNKVGRSGAVEIRPSDSIRAMDFTVKFFSQKNLESFIEIL